MRWWKEWSIVDFIDDGPCNNITDAVRTHLKANRIDVAVMPASTTYKYQLIDVSIGKPFKDGIYEQWATWMLNENDSLGPTGAGNRKHPTRPNVLDWVQKARDGTRPDTITNTKTVPKVHMQANPGRPIEGYDESEDIASEDEIDDELEF